jgi:capsular polysaccharide biosynthesis protein
MSGCILHVGMMKTGTSSIQNSLKGFEDSKFVWYPDRNGRTNHTPAVFGLVGGVKPNKRYSGPEKPPEFDARERFERVFKALGERTLIVSGEGMAFLNLTQLEQLREYFRVQGVGTPKIVAYVRPPAGFITSVSRATLGGMLRSLHFEKKSINYRERFEKFDLAFGRDNVSLWKFAPATFPSGDVVRDFCSRIGIDFPAERIVRVNDSISAEVVALLYTYHNYGVGYGSREMMPQQKLKLVQRLAGIGNTQFRFSPDLLRSFLESNRSDIEWIEARLGEPLQEELGEHQLGDVREERDLLRLAGSVRDELLALLGGAAPKGVRGDTPEEIAALVHGLRGNSATKDRAHRRRRAAGETVVEATDEDAERAEWLDASEAAANADANGMAVGRQSADSGTRAPPPATGTASADRQQFIYYPANLSEPWVRQFDLPVVTLANALVTGICRPGKDERQAAFTGGVYDSSGALVRHSERQVGRGIKPSNPEQISLPEARRLPGRTYFCGIAFRHFGHWLIESMSRLWAVAEQKAPADRFLFQGWGAGCKPELFERSHISYMLEGLGISPGDCEILGDESVICEELVVPASTLVVNGYTHPRFVDIYRRILAAHKITPECISRVYLSRRGLSDLHRAAENEDEIEALLTSHGFTVLHPQRLPFETQLRIMQGADVIAGTDGSQLHMAAYARPDAKVLAFDSRVSPNQYAVEAASGLQAVHIMANAGRRPKQGRGGRFWVADLDRVQEALRRIEDLAGPFDPASSPSAAVLNRVVAEDVTRAASTGIKRPRREATKPPAERPRRRDTMDVIELMQQARPDMFKDIGAEQAHKLADSVFAFVNERLAQTEEGVVSFDKLGRFRKRKPRDTADGEKSTVGNIAFHPARRS